MSHFQSAGSHATCVRSLTWEKDYTVVDEVICCFKRRRHVSAFAYQNHAVLDEFFSAVQVKLVLSSAWESDIALNRPDILVSFGIFCRRNGFYVFADSSASYFFDFLDYVEIDTVLVIYVSARVRHSHYFTAELLSFLTCVDSYVTGTGDNNSLAEETHLLFALQCLLRNIYKTVSSSFGSYQATAVSKSATCEYAVMLVADSLILTEEITYFSCAYADVACRHV